MSNKPPIILMVIRAAMIFGPVALLLGLWGACNLWPESEYARTWEIAYYVLAVAAVIAFFATRTTKK